MKQDRNEGFQSQQYDSNKKFNRENDFRQDNDYSNQSFGNSDRRDRNYSGGYFNSSFDNDNSYGSQGYNNQYSGSNDYSRRQQRGFGSNDQGFGEYGTGYAGNVNSYQRERSYDDARNYGNRYGNQGRDNRSWWDRTADEVSSWFGDDDAERRRMQDRQNMGQHRGKGPKGFTRSDDRILEDVCSRLSDDYNVDATDIDVKVENGEVTLTGTVNDRNQKRRAEDVVERITGVHDVENRIKVKREDTTVGTERGTTF